ncbi:MAG TPA: hypothetical protein VMT03_13905 [Polyangia bacterium]|nr:hypothetical protein [Polyangia bacterium]
MSTTLFVDAIEGGIARLLAGTEAFSVPVRLLPPGTREGTWLSASFVVVPPPPDRGEQIRRRLGRNDDGGDIKL